MPVLWIPSTTGVCEWRLYIQAGQAMPQGRRGHYDTEDFCVRTSSQELKLALTAEESRTLIIFSAKYRIFASPSSESLYFNTPRIDLLSGGGFS